MEHNQMYQVSYSLEKNKVEEQNPLKKTGGSFLRKALRVVETNGDQQIFQETRQDTREAVRAGNNLIITLRTRCTKKSQGYGQFSMKKGLLILIAIIGFGISANAQTKEIIVSPDNARISIGGTNVGTGSYSLTMNRKQDFVILKLSAIGYYTEEVRINRDDKTKTYNFTLERDESYLASSESADIANKTMRVAVKNGMTQSEAWKRLMFYVSDNFETFEINDNAAGWIRTAYDTQTFGRITIRTRIEVKKIPGQNNETVYRILLTSEWAYASCGRNDQCFSKWDRLLKKYDTMIKDIQNALN